MVIVTSCRFLEGPRLSHRLSPHRLWEGYAVACGHLCTQVEQKGLCRGQGQDKGWSQGPQGGTADGVPSSGN